MTPARALATLVAAATLVLATPTSSLAGTYSVYGCRLPSGATIPAYGWQPSSNAMWVRTDESCRSGGGITAELNSDISHKADYTGAAWSFYAPAGTRIISFAGHRMSRVGAGQAYGSPGSTLSDSSKILDQCVRFYGCAGWGSTSAWAAPENAFSFGDLDTSSVSAHVSCGGGGTCPAENPSAIVTLFRSEIRLSDDFDPQVTGPSGTLTGSGPHHGIESISFNATDQGSGIYRAVVEIDGKVSSDLSLDAGDSRCSDIQPANGDPYEFLHSQPCKLSVGATLPLDTTRIPDGDHQFEVRVFDASGNGAAVFGPAPLRVANGAQPAASRGALNGTNGSDAAHVTAWFTGGRERELKTRFGRRVKAQGRLVNDRDEGVANALIEVANYRGNRQLGRREQIRTHSDGSFAVLVRRNGPSRRLRITYKSHSGDRTPVSAAELRLRVIAGLSLQVAPKSVHNGDVLTFRGRLLGGPVPRGGKLIEVQVRYPTHWGTFATVRTRRGGAFVYRRRLLRTFQPTTYAFRIRARQEASYPYETGVSRVVHVRVR